MFSFKQKSFFLTKCTCSLCLPLFFELDFNVSAVFTEVCDCFFLSVTNVGKIMKMDHRGPISAFSCVCKLAVVIQLIVKGCKMYSLCYYFSINYL